MADTVVEALILVLLDWVAQRERTYEEVMDAWRTSCPKLPVWEDANDHGFIETQKGIVTITASGRALLARRRDSVITPRRKPGDATNE